MKFLVLNGPNLNLLGKREPGVYGTGTYAGLCAEIAAYAAARGIRADIRQSNHEGDLIDWVHEAGHAQGKGDAVGAVINAGAYTHTSVALHDAIKGAQLRVVELHISNVHAREAFRHHSYLSPVSLAVMCGFGVAGYPLALQGLVQAAG